MDKEVSKQTYDKLRVHSYETFGATDGPGIRFVLFLQGCNLRCLYCENPDTQNMKGGKEMSIEEILELLERQREYFGTKGGLTISGGEPTLQSQNLQKLFKECTKRKIHTALDTNGTIYSKDVLTLYDLTDLVILDVKHIDDKEHLKLTGGSNKNVLKLAEYRENTGKPIWLRYVLVPGYNDQSKYLVQWAQTFKDYKTVERVEILPYHTLGQFKYDLMGKPYHLKDTPTPSKDLIKTTLEIFKKYFINKVTVQ
jgi:pyruvate formate lyase activating enzyme